MRCEMIIFNVERKEDGDERDGGRNKAAMPSQDTPALARTYTTPCMSRKTITSMIREHARVPQGPQTPTSDIPPPTTNHSSPLPRELPPTAAPTKSSDRTSRGEKIPKCVNGITQRV